MGKINVYNKIVIENQKKRRKYGHKKNFHVNLHLTDGIHSLLRRDNSRGSADITYHIWRISLLCGSGI